MVRSQYNYTNLEYVPKWIKLYKSGLTTGQIAQEYGVTPSTVRNRLKEAGEFDPNFRPRAAISDKQLDDMKRFHSAGYSHADIAELMDINATTVRRHLLALGLTRKAKAQAAPR